MTDRRTVDTINDDQLSQLYDDLDRAEAANERARALVARWAKAGPPPLGVSVSRWWDARLAELNAALNEPAKDRP